MERCRRAGDRRSQRRGRARLPRRHHPLIRGSTHAHGRRRHQRVQRRLAALHSTACRALSSDPRRPPLSGLLPDSRRTRVRATTARRGVQRASSERVSMYIELRSSGPGRRCCPRTSISGLPANTPGTRSPNRITMPIDGSPPPRFTSRCRSCRTTASSTAHRTSRSRPRSTAESCWFLPRNVVSCRGVLSRLAGFSRAVRDGHMLSTIRRARFIRADQVASAAEVSGYLVGSPAFKAGGRGDPTTAGSIPVHLRHVAAWSQRCRDRRGHRIAEQVIRTGSCVLVVAGHHMRVHLQRGP